MNVKDFDSDVASLRNHVPSVRGDGDPRDRLEVRQISRLEIERIQGTAARKSGGSPSRRSMISFDAMIAGRRVAAQLMTPQAEGYLHRAVLHVRRDARRATRDDLEAVRQRLAGATAFPVNICSSGPRTDSPPAQALAWCTHWPIVAPCLLLAISHFVSDPLLSEARPPGFRDTGC